MDNMAAGIGVWDNINNYVKPGGSGLTEENSLQNHPSTVKNVTLTVGGNVYAESTKNLVYNKRVSNVAVGGMLNDMSYGGLFINLENFSNNKVTIQGDIVAKSNYGKGMMSAASEAYLWGCFTGNNNEFSANSIQSSEKDNSAYAAPYHSYLRGEGNKVSVPGGIFVNSSGDYAAGVAMKVAEYDGEKNKVEEGPITTTHPAIVGGFAEEVGPIRGHDRPRVKDGVYFYVEPRVKNVHIAPEIIVQSDGQNYTREVFLGGFVGHNKGTIEDASVKLSKPVTFSVSKNANVAGFVGKNEGKIFHSSACIPSIDIDGGKNHVNVAGFAAYGKEDTIKSATALVNDSLKVTNGNYVNVGGFRAVAFDCADDNNAAQVGEDIATNNNIGLVNIGGYAGKIQAYSGKLNPEVKNATALVFGDMRGQTVKSSFGPAGNALLGNTSAGFIGAVNGKVSQGPSGQTKVSPVDVFDCAAYVGGRMFSEYPDKNGISGSVGILYGGRMRGFTVIAHATDDSVQNVITANNYLEDMAYSEYNDDANFYVEVKDGKRTAWPVHLSNQPDGSQSFDKTHPEKPIGEITVAPRLFQREYWGKEASPDKAALPYKDFDYVTNNGVGALEGISKEKDAIATAADFSKVTLDSYCARHLAIRKNHVTYDILGIPDVVKTGKVAFDLNYVKEDGTRAGVYKEIESALGAGIGEKFPQNPTREGYEFLGWNAAADGSKVAFTADTIVVGDVTVYAQWKKIETPAKPIGDYFLSLTPIRLNQEDHFAYLFGYPDETFRPDKSMTRAEVAAMFVRLMEKEPEASAVSFADVDRSAWYYGYIAKAEAAGILKGYEDNTFRPDGEITRAEFAAVATRFEKLTPSPITFGDVPGSYWAHDAIAAAYGRGWIAGYEDNTFRPEQKIKRSEVAAMTNRVLNRYADRDWIQANRRAVVNFKDIDESHWAFYSVIEATNGHDYTRRDDGKNEIWIRLNDFERR